MSKSIEIIRREEPRNPLAYVSKDSGAVYILGPNGKCIDRHGNETPHNYDKIHPSVWIKSYTPLYSGDIIRISKDIVL
jgi:hypothetical protein